jgi:hypothetical protein
MQADGKQEHTEASTSGRPFFTDHCTAFIRGLPQSVEEHELEAVFADTGGVKDVRITRDHATGQPKVRRELRTHRQPCMMNLGRLACLRTCMCAPSSLCPSAPALLA